MRGEREDDMQEWSKDCKFAAHGWRPKPRGHQGTPIQIKFYQIIRLVKKWMQLSLEVIHMEYRIHDKFWLHQKEQTDGGGWECVCVGGGC